MATYRSIVAASCGAAMTMGLIYAGTISQVAMRESPFDSSRYNNNPKKEDDSDRSNDENAIASRKERRSLLTSMDVEILKKKGLVIIDNVLTAEEVKKAQKEVNEMIDRKAGSIFQINEHDDEKVRTDHVAWISEPFDGKIQKLMIDEGLLYALRCIREIPYALLQNGYEECKEDDMGVPFSNQLACYDARGSHYIAHRDCPERVKGQFQHPLKWALNPGLEDRNITIILYLNDISWNEKQNGGSLRCYIGADQTDDIGTTATEVMDINPIGGRMVIFNSKTVLHEVLPSAARRTAITCWVGGSHSKYVQLRRFCIPRNEILWL